MDVILAAVAIILVFIMLVRPAQKEVGFYRQADVAVGCFASGSGAWSEEFFVYTRNSTEDESWNPAMEAVRPLLFRSTLKQSIAPDEGYTRLAIMVDPAGATCADRNANGNGAAIWKAIQLLPDLEETRDWVFVTEILPCVDRAFCEAMLGLPEEI